MNRTTGPAADDVDGGSRSRATKPNPTEPRPALFDSKSSDVLLSSVAKC